MNCNGEKFVVSKGSDNIFTFIIKQDLSTLPMVIEPSDTFTATLIRLTDETPYPQVTDKSLQIVDAQNGKVSLTIPEADTLDLVSKKGKEVDRFYPIPTYKLLIECNTVNNGNFIAKVAEVYAD